MSRSQKPIENNDNRIPKDPSGKEPETTTACNPLPESNRTEKTHLATSKGFRSMMATHSDGSIIKNQEQSGIKQKLVNKVKSWNAKDGRILQDVGNHDSNLSNLAMDFENLNMDAHNSDDNLYKSDLLRAKDSLEDLIGHRNIKTVSGDAVASRSFSHPIPSTEGREGPHSEPSIGADVSDSTSRVVTWDPWNRSSRKNKKENKRRRTEKSPHHSRDNSRPRSPIVKSLEHNSGDELRFPIGELTSSAESSLYSSPEPAESYEYQPYHSNKKSVDFVNEVVVVYLTGDEVTTRSTEPLKKELEQQVRNKEMRRGHIPCTIVGSKQSSGENYMAAWLKK